MEKDSKLDLERPIKKKGEKKRETEREIKFLRNLIAVKM